MHSLPVHSTDSVRPPLIIRSESHDLREFTFQGIIGACFSFEALFLLFLFAGRFKADPRFSWIPVDLTALLFCCSVGVGFLVLFQRGYRLPQNLFLYLLTSLSFFLYLVMSQRWSWSKYYSADKALYVGFLTTFTSLACAFVLSSSRKRIFRFYLLIILFSAWISVERILIPAEAGASDTDYNIGGSYLGVGRSVGVALICCLVLGLKCARTSLERQTLYALAGFFALVLMAMGGRMPFLATGAGVVTIFLYEYFASHNQRVRKRIVFRLMSLTAVSFLAGFLIFSLGNTEFDLKVFERLLVLLEDDSGTSASSRLKSWEASIQFWSERPIFGYGLGSFPVISRGEDFRGYPHNLILEVLVESGLIGFLLLLCFFWACLRNLLPIQGDPVRLSILAIFVNAFCNAMVSGDIPDNRLLFGILGLMFVAKSRR